LFRSPWVHKLSVGMEKIASSIWLSDAVHAENIDLLRFHHITHIVNTTRQEFSYPEGFTSILLGLDDLEHESLLSVFPAAFSFIDAALVAGCDGFEFHPFSVSYHCF